MNKDIFVYIEQRDREIQNVSFELLGEARRLVAVSGGDVCGVLVGNNISNLAKEVVANGADKVYVVDNAELALYTTECYAQAIAAVIAKYSPNAMLFGASTIGRDLAPRLSARVHTGLTADCTDLKIDEEGNLFMTRPAFGGSLFATIACPNHRPQMSTVRPGVMKKVEYDANRAGAIIVEEVSIDANKFAVKVLEEVKETKAAVKIEDAKILVSMGRGLENNKAQVEAFAEVIGGTVSCSRAVVDAGVWTSARQVGQTGKTVRPDAYFAMGISGAVQHIAGMDGSDLIIAINKDKNAAIFNTAHLGIVGDATKIMPELEKEILARK